MKRDLRQYARQTNIRLAIGGVLLLFLLGGGLIYLIWGPSAAVTGLICLGAGMLPLVTILVVFWVMDWVVKRANKD